MNVNRLSQAQTAPDKFAFAVLYLTDMDCRATDCRGAGTFGSGEELQFLARFWENVPQNLRCPPVGCGVVR